MRSGTPRAPHTSRASPRNVGDEPSGSATCLRLRSRRPEPGSWLLERRRVRGAVDGVGNASSVAARLQRAARGAAARRGAAQVRVWRSARRRCSATLHAAAFVAARRPAIAAADARSAAAADGLLLLPLRSRSDGRGDGHDVGTMAARAAPPTAEKLHASASSSSSSLNVSSSARRARAPGAQPLREQPLAASAARKTSSAPTALRAHGDRRPWWRRFERTSRSTVAQRRRRGEPRQRVGPAATTCRREKDARLSRRDATKVGARCWPVCTNADRKAASAARGAPLLHPVTRGDWGWRRCCAAATRRRRAEVRKPLPRRQTGARIRPPLFGFRAYRVVDGRIAVDAAPCTDFRSLNGKRVRA